MESKLHAYTDVKNAIHRMLESNNVVRGSSTEHSLSILEQKWATVYSKIQERKVIELLYRYIVIILIVYNLVITFWVFLVISLFCA